MKTVYNHSKIVSKVQLQLFTCIHRMVNELTKNRIAVMTL